MRALLVSAAISTLACNCAHATSSLTLEAQGYLLDIVVGDASKPIIAHLAMTRPEGTTMATLPMRYVKVDIFDTKHRILLLHFKNPGDATLPESFRLTVKEGVGTLRIGKKSLVGSFFWGM